VAELAALLELPIEAAWRDLGGSWTTNLLLDDPHQGAVVVRVHRTSTTVGRLAAEQAARAELARAGVPTVLPIVGRTGSSISALASGRLVEVEPFVSCTAQMKTPRLMVRGFAMLAMVHNGLSAAVLPPEARTVSCSNHIETDIASAATRDGANRIRGWKVPPLSRFADEVVAHVERVTELERRSVEQLPRQVTHGDFWDNNVLFDGDHVTAVLDFGFMAERSRVDDLALPIWFYLLEPGHGLPGAAEVQLVRDMVDAYDAASSEPLSEAERLAVPLAVARQPAWSVGGWVPVLDHDEALAHARSSVAELPVAQAVLRDLDLWQRALSAGHPPWRDPSSVRGRRGVAGFADGILDRRVRRPTNRSGG